MWICTPEKYKLERKLLAEKLTFLHSYAYAPRCTSSSQNHRAPHLGKFWLRPRLLLSERLSSRKADGRGKDKVYWRSITEADDLVT